MMYVHDFFVRPVGSAANRGMLAGSTIIRKLYGMSSNGVYYIKRG